MEKRDKITLAIFGTAMSIVVGMHALYSYRSDKRQQVATEAYLESLKKN